MSEDESRALYDVPAQDDAGKPVTVRLRPNCGVVTIEVVQADGSALAKIDISITDTGRFASFFGECVHGAAGRLARSVS